MYHTKMAPEDDTAERARVPPVRDKFRRPNPRTLSGRLRTGKGRQTSQTIFLDPSEGELLQQLYRLHGPIRSDLLAYLHATVLSLHENHLSQKTEQIAAWGKSDLNHHGDLSLLKCTGPQNVDLEGIPNSATCDEVVEYLRNIDPQLDIASTAAKVLIKPPVLLHDNQVAQTTIATVTDFEITENIRNFIRCGRTGGNVPSSLFIRRKFKTKFKLELSVWAELEQVITLLETSNWTKTEIESLLFKAVGYCLYANPMTSDVSLHINVNTFEGKILRRLPCSRGRIILLFKDVKSVASINTHTASLQNDIFE